MANRKAPSPAPGTPGYRGPRQVKPEPPPAPPPKRVSTFQHDEPVLRYQAHIDIPPDPPSAFPANREIREGDRKPKAPPPPHWSKDPGWPPSGPKAYRLARKGDLYRVEKFGYGWLGAAKWRPCSPEFANRDAAERHIERLRFPVATDPSWQPVED